MKSKQKLVRSFLLVYSISIFVSSGAQAALCSKWSKAEEVGAIPTKPISESSGIIASSGLARLYHNNDSGDRAVIYVTDLSGKLLNQFSYLDSFPLDVEDLSYGPCSSSSDKKCIYVGDIGDNLGIRGQLDIHVIEEQAKWPASVKPIRTVQVSYPDGKHDAEAFAVHPSGDIYFVTKNYLGKKPFPAGVYRLEAAKVAEGGAQTLSKIGEIDIPTITKSKERTQVVTSMSISPDGEKFLLLTYREAIEFDIDLAKAKANVGLSLKAGVDYQIVPITLLPQTEALTYAADGRSFFYTSEAKAKLFKKAQASPLMHVKCVSN